MPKDKESGREMSGVGGPLLCIGDLLSDVADDGGVDIERRQSPPPSPPIAASVDSLSPYDLQQLFQENYDLLIDSLSGTDHSWTSSTLKLCAALEKADKLILSANSSTSLLLEKIELLESILKRGDAAVIKALEIVQAAKEAERL
ncbi:uncharacterized protein LOC110098259 [Dendrobium catenatum]|uniref:Uncharacterized protein n=1 Tax=Dendrobium catenatum TaxID=906689 RepID=A0A2I0X7Q5_9ASPA|nr:uncharacterized protein LOC110098259 [Dendrobium catenatum]PKU83944.1 hypothetical protein MA16_Dca006419 [Dendrobium catenatum]